MKVKLLGKLAQNTREVKSDGTIRKKRSRYVTNHHDEDQEECVGHEKNKDR